jgi:hypothetical protein
VTPLVLRAFGPKAISLVSKNSAWPRPGLLGAWVVPPVPVPSLMSPKSVMARVPKDIWVIWPRAKSSLSTGFAPTRSAV